MKLQRRMTDPKVNLVLSSFNPLVLRIAMLSRPDHLLCTKKLYNLFASSFLWSYEQTAAKNRLQPS